MKVITVSLAFIIGFAGPLWADRVQIDQEDVFFLDTDGDGAISGPEYAEFAYFAFRTIDTNDSGTLSPNEVEKHLTSDDFAIMDTNGDGRISKKEWAAQLNADFAAADRDGDGALD
ncbi:MAG: EF-hand domain-containing protein [Pseudomonadota bacterium]